MTSVGLELGVFYTAGRVICFSLLFLNVYGFVLFQNTLHGIRFENQLKLKELQE